MLAAAFVMLPDAHRPAHAAPANDNLADSIAIATPTTSGIVAVADTTGATTEGSENLPCGGIGATVWYTWTSPGSPGTVVFDTWGSDFDTVLAIYTGSGYPLASAGCNDDLFVVGALNRQSGLALTYAASTTYRIQVGGFGGLTGQAVLNMSLGAAIYVNSTGDTNTADSAITLREATALAYGGTATLGRGLDPGEAPLVLNAAGALGIGSSDLIHFAPNDFPPATPATITLGTGLFSLRGGDNVSGIGAGVIVDGVDKTLACFSIVSGAGNAVEGIQIRRCDGAIVSSVSANSQRIGGTLIPGQRNVIRENDIGIYVINSDQTLIQGNYIGVDATGTVAMGNEFGIQFTSGSNSNTIGGTSAAARNVISGNTTYGILVGTDLSIGHTVQGNHIGTNAAGTASLGNGTGIWFGGGTYSNIIGGSAAGAGNVISGNGDGVRIDGAALNYMQGNFIGTNAAGTAALGNGRGVVIDGGSVSNQVGGFAAGERNVISGNGGAGVAISAESTDSNAVVGNYIGTDVTGTVAVGNSAGVFISQGDGTLVQQNVISGNTTGVDIREVADSTQILGNLIGTNVNGNADLGNSLDGISLSDTEAQIGGTSPGNGNVISGNNSDGIEITAATGYTLAPVIQGNKIGTDVTGMADLGNSVHGINVDAVGGGTLKPAIGGAAMGAGNVISGNNSDGIRIDGEGGDGATAYGNRIGTNAPGTGPLANSVNGVMIMGGADLNLIGGTGTGEGNLIAYNTGNGVTVSDLATLRNTVRGNSIHGNGGFGIDLFSNGNGSVATPSVTGVSGFTITGLACSGCTVDIYSDEAGQGRFYHGSTSAGVGGNFSVALSYTAQNITATATDNESTSEFSSPFFAGEFCDGLDNDGDTVVDEGNPDTDADGIKDCVDPDDDGDNVVDNADSCPLVAEDIDGFQDADGCPDTDNDLDGVPDVSDSGKTCFDPAATLSCPTTACPNVAEDYDAFKDSDGCPEPDNDNDGFPDVTDACPGTDTHAGLDGMLGAPQDLNHNGIKDLSEAAFSTDDVVLTFEDYDGVIDTDGCHDSPGDDFDGDTFSDDTEALFLGTNPMNGCSLTSTAHDEDPDPWPPDFDDNQVVNISDLIPFKPHYGAVDPDPNYNARFDLNADGAIQITDLIPFKPFYLQNCTP